MPDQAPSTIAGDADGGCVIVVTAAPDLATADRLADALVARGLAAAVHSREVRTRYRWKGRIESGTEHVLDIYAPRSALPEIEALILSDHPYEMPPVHAVPIVGGPSAYLRWIATAGHFPDSDPD